MEWDGVRVLQELCGQIKRQEVEWSKTHFDELTLPKWLLLNKTIHDSYVDMKSDPKSDNADEAPDGLIEPFVSLRPKVLAAWRKWLASAPNGMTAAATLPGALVSSPVSIGAMVYSAATQPTTALTVTKNAWINEFGKKPADIQLLVWLHLLVERPPPDTPVESLLWNLVTVVQHSPLPFVVRAKLSLAAYDRIIFVAQGSGSHSDATSGGAEKSARPLSEWAELAKKGGVEKDFHKTLWETAHFGKTRPSVANDIKSYFDSQKLAAPESASTYMLLSKLDQQNKQAELSSADEIVARMIHVTNVFTSSLTPDSTAMNLLLKQVAQPLLSRLDSTLGRQIVELARLLHLHSLLTFAQMRRATLVVWTLVYGIAKK